MTSSARTSQRYVVKLPNCQWGIENKCHHLLDVTYHEGHNQVRDRICAQNLTLVREISAKVLRDPPLKGSIKPEHRSWRHRIRRHHWQHKPPGDLGQYQLDTAAAIANVLCSQAWHRLRPLELRN